MAIKRKTDERETTSYDSIMSVVMRNSETFLAAVTDRYLNSDFNDLPLFLQDLSDEGRTVVRRLLEAGQIELNFGDSHPNTHIKAIWLGPIDEQLKKLADTRDTLACAYPTPAHLERVVDKDSYAGEPFRLRLALGEPELQHCAFELAILEIYRNDPRYSYVCNDVSGRISVSDSYFGDTGMREADQILLENFGFCYDECLNRAVAAYLRYLSRLSPEHQQIWEARRLQGEFRLHPDFLGQTCGHMPNSIPVFSAFLEEQRIINELCGRIGKPPLFRHVDKPRHFGFLIRPTRLEYNQFVHTLDRLMSDNLNREFFRGDIDLEEEITRTDSRIEVRQKSTIWLLREWLELRFRTSDRQPIDDTIKTFRDVRQQRQKPAHKLDDDHFDQAYLRQQRGLVGRAYSAMNVLRQIFCQHPANIDIERARKLDELEVRLY